MTNPADAIKALVTYAVCIPLAILVGYLLSDPLTFDTMGTIAFVVLIILIPVFIKWHYPILLLALASPIVCFFIPGRPPLTQVMILLSFGIAIIDRAMNSEKRFISPRVMVWPILYTVAIVYMTAKLTGGIGLKTLGGGVDGGVGGGKKYLELFIGIAGFFALTSRVIPKERRNLFVAFYFLGGLPSFIGDLFPILPGPLKYINLLIPPSGSTLADSSASFSVGGLADRLGSFATTAGVILNFMLAKYGLRGIFLSNRPLRIAILLGSLCLSMIGGFRITLMTDLFMFGLLFYLEGLHRTRLLAVTILGVVFCAALLIPFSRDLPFAFQRCLTIFPLDLDPAIVSNAEGSTQWRHDMWADLWPKVPGYLLLGKGYALTATDYELMGNGQFANGVEGQLDKSSIGLAVSGDYHNGPLSTLIPFGIWGAISILWLLAVALFVAYRNYKYSEPDLKHVNTYMFVLSVWHTLCFFFVFGAYSDDVSGICRSVGFSVALNWGIRAAKRAVAPARPVRFRKSKPISAPQPQAV